MINYHDLRAKLEESIAMYEHAIEEFDAFISEYGLQDAFNTFCERAARGIEGSKMTLDEAEDTGGNYDEADIEAEREEEERRQEKEKRQEEEDKKKLNQESEQADKRDENPIYKKIWEYAIDAMHTEIRGIDFINATLSELGCLEFEGTDHGVIPIFYEELNSQPEEELGESDYEGLGLCNLDINSGHIIEAERYRSWEKGVLIALAYALKRTSYKGLSQQSRDLFAPLKKLLDYEAVSRASYMLFSALHVADIDKIISERDDMHIMDVIEKVENDEYDEIYESLKEGDTQKLETAYRRMDEAIEMLKGMEKTYPDALNVTELTPGIADPEYYFKNLNEVQDYVRSKIQDLSGRTMEEKNPDRKKRKTR